MARGLKITKVDGSTSENSDSTSSILLVGDVHVGSKLPPPKGVVVIGMGDSSDHLAELMRIASGSPGYAPLQIVNWNPKVSEEDQWAIGRGVPSRMFLNTIKLPKLGESIIFESEMDRINLENKILSSMHKPDQVIITGGRQMGRAALMNMSGMTREELYLMDSFTVDTRDFSFEKLEEVTVNNHILHIASKYPERFIYSLKEVETSLTRAFHESGGKLSHRVLIYKDYPKESRMWQLRVIKLIKLEEDKYLILNDKGILCKKEMWKSELDLN